VLVEFCTCEILGDPKKRVHKEKEEDVEFDDKGVEPVLL
jgi:hypothetical protein